MSDVSLSSSKPDDQSIDKESNEETDSDTIDGPNPYEEFNYIFINDRFLKSSTILQFAKLLNESVLFKLLAVSDREDFIKYVEAIYRHLRLNPQKFLFFVSKPEPSEKDEKEVIMVRCDRKIICIRDKSTYMLKGHIAHIFFKNKSKIQITMSKGLFIKLTVWKELKNLKEIIPDFLNLSENTQPHTVEELFFKSLMDLPSKLSELNHILKNSFLSLILTANLEFCRKLALIDFKEDDIFKVSQNIMFIFLKSHLWDHLMRALIPLYIKKQVENVETIMADYNVYLVPCLLHICRLHFGQNFLPQVSKVLYPIVCQKNFDEYSVLTFVQLVLNMNFPSQILLIAKELYKAVKAKFSEDEYAAPSVIGSFLITDFIFPEILKNVVEKDEKRKYLTFLNVLTFNNEFKEGAHFFDIIKKLYISLGESEVTTTRLSSVEKSVFSHHVTHLFNYFQENASYLYNQFSKIDLSKEKTPVYCEIMELFECIELIKCGKESVKENYEEELILELNQVHEKIKKGKIKIKRTNKNDVKQIVKKQNEDRKKMISDIKEKKVEKKKQDKKKMIADIKEKKVEKKKQEKLEKKNAKKLEKKNTKKDESLTDEKKDDGDDESKNEEVDDIEHPKSEAGDDLDEKKMDDDDSLKIDDDSSKVDDDKKIDGDEFKADDGIIKADDGIIKADDDIIKADDDIIKAYDGIIKADDDIIKADDEIKIDDDTKIGGDEIKVDDDDLKIDDDEIKGEDEFKVVDGDDIKIDDVTIGDEVKDDTEFKIEDDAKPDDDIKIGDDTEFKFDDDAKIEDEFKADDDAKIGDGVKVDVDGIGEPHDPSILGDDLDHIPEADATMGTVVDPDAEIKPEIDAEPEAAKDADDDISPKKDAEPEIEKSKTKGKGKTKETKDKTQKKKFSIFKKKG